MSKDFIEKYGKPGVHFPERETDLNSWGADDDQVQPMIDNSLDSQIRSVRAKAIQHPKATVDHITKALEDNSWIVRKAAIQHPKVTIDHITKALNDKDLHVRIVARKRMKDFK